MKAVDRYDWRKGFRFSTYATWWIRQQATRALADQGKTIRIPVYMHETALRIMREADVFKRDSGRAPTALGLSTRLSMPVAKVAALLARMEEPVSLHDPDVDGVAPLDWLEDESVWSDPARWVDRVALGGVMAKMVSALDPRQAEVLTVRFGLESGDPKTLEETGVHLGVTRERIRQIEKSALTKLAHHMGAKVLRSFLDTRTSDEPVVRTVESHLNDKLNTEDELQSNKVDARPQAE